MMYCMLYGILKGLIIISTTIICKRALQLDGIHVYQPFKVPIEEHLKPHRRAELSILSCIKKNSQDRFHTIH